MKITDVSVTLFSWAATANTRLPGPGGHPRSGDLGYVRVETDEGLVGESFLGSLDSPASFDARQLVHWAKPILLGQDPLERERLCRRLTGVVRYTGHRVLGALDVALWDLVGKAAGLPVHRLLGTARTELPVYVSSQCFLDEHGYVEQALELKSDGWRGYKLHPPKIPTLDIAILRAVREACGDDYPLMLDGGWRYDYAAALRVGHALEDARYLWFEDPFPWHEIYQTAKLREQLSIPLLATEQPAGGLESYPAWILARATDMLRGDVPTKGGITGMIKAAHLAEAFGMNYEPHYSGNALSDLAGVHVAMAIANCDYVESLVPDPVHTTGARRGLDIDSAGVVHAPKGPGLGAEPDHEYIERFRLNVVS